MTATEQERSKFEGWAILWRDVPGYEGMYEVSNLGEVRSLNYEPPRELKQSLYRNGYRKVQLWKYGEWQNRGVHQVVAAAFIGPCPPGHEINHKDGVKANNRLSNLEYVTRSGNLAHAHQTGLRRSAKGSTTAKRQPRAWIGCRCGCGEMIETPDVKGRRRNFVTGHNMRRAS